VLAKRRSVAVRQGSKEACSKPATDGQKPNMRQFRLDELAKDNKVYIRQSPEL